MVPFALPLKASSRLPMHRQLYNELREAVLSGRLGPGARLPSTRELAEELRVSRNTVMSAFDQLLAEGYLEGKVGSGTYVAEKLPEEMLVARSAARDTPRIHVPGGGLSGRGAVLAASPVVPPRPHRAPRAFRPAPAASDAFPGKIWLRLLAKRWRGPLREMLAYGEAGGYQPLREAIAAYVRSARAVRCEAAQVVVVSGSQQGIDLAARLLLDPGDSVWVEDPGYLGARGAFLGAGAQLVPVPVDDEGLIVRQGVDRSPYARMVYVTPSHQFPLAVTMSLSRRLALLDWVRRSGAWIIEDDYDSEFRYAGRPLASLQGLDFTGRVIYLGTFSKVLFPSLRLGYLILPPNLVEAFTAARALVDRHSPLIDQAVLADFISEGHFSRHVRRMRNLYQARQAVLVEAARQELQGLLDVQPLGSGMHLVGWLPEGVDDRAASRAAREHGIEAPPLSAYAVSAAQRPGLLLGYTALNGREIREGVRKLAAALKSVRSASASAGA
jgi:GntR family transcriptional regulator / MocR family aminotransferase